MTTFKEMVREGSIMHAARIRSVTERFLEQLHISLFYYGITTWEGALVEISNHVAWMTFYADKEFYKINPMNVHPRFLASGVIYAPLIMNSGYQRIWLAAEKEFNILLSLHFLERTSVGVTKFGFGIPASSSEFSTLLINEIPLLRKFARHFQNETKDIFKHLEKTPVNMAQEMGALFNQNPDLPKISLSPRERHTALNCFQFIDSAVLNVKFTAREFDCIQLLLQGRTATSISQTLDISKRTVESYIENIKAKLGCDRKMELIAQLRNIREVGLLESREQNQFHI